MHRSQALLHGAFLHETCDTIAMNQMNQASAAVAYVRFVLDELKLSASGLAKGAGLASTTITRALNDPDHKFELSMSTLKKIAAFSGISPTPFFEARDFAELTLNTLTLPDVYDSTWGPDASKPFDMDGVIAIIGSASVGIYRKREAARIEDAAPLLLKIGNITGDRLFALRMDDDSANKYVPKGFYVICHRLGDDNQANHGSLVAVERRAEGGHLVEISIWRLIVPETGAPYLRLDTNDKRLAETIPLGTASDSDNPILIFGTVLYVISNARDEVLLDELRQRVLKRTGA